jgi:hypothetical protein
MIIADAGVPMLVVFWPPAILALLPIIFLEAWIGKLTLKEPFGRCVKVATVSNLFSTLLGIPLTWIVLVFLEAIAGNGGAPELHTFSQKVYAVTIQAPWLIPYEKDLYWMVPTAVVVLSVPFYLASVIWESRIAIRRLPERTAKEVWRWMWIANAASYILLVGCICAVLFYFR